MSKPIERGAMARTNKQTRQADDGASRWKGFQFIVEDYVTAAESEDGRAFYWGSTPGDGLNDVCFYEDDVELDLSKEAMDARTIPSVSDIAEHLASESHGGDLGIHESDWGGGEGIINLYGTTPEGLSFAATVKVLSVERTDF